MPFFIPACIMIGLTERAKRDVERITSDPKGFGVAISFTAPTGQMANVYGRSKNIRIGVNPLTLEVVNSLDASVSVSESLLNRSDYPVRDESGEVSMNKHLIEVKDSSGRLGKFVIKETYPDQVLGLIVMKLGSYE